jgi:hypothetical protein
MHNPSTTPRIIALHGESDDFTSFAVGNFRVVFTPGATNPSP